MAKLLELDGIGKSFGGLDVIANLTMHVDEGEIVSVIGPNGAGKTTLFNVVNDDVLFAFFPGEPTATYTRLSGVSLAGPPPPAIAPRAVARTFQTLRLFLNMTVKENVMAATYGHTKARAWQSILRTPKARREEQEIPVTYSGKVESAEKMSGKVQFGELGEGTWTATK